MIEFTQQGRKYRGYTGGHYFCNGIEITPAEFHAALLAQHPQRRV